ncbi:hypothetical protein QC820_16500, partial [Halomonas mongoliensis]|nr:hypothetical protein [Halomonas mongoliensis]
MRATARDLCNLYIRGNWGFSNTLTKIRGFGKDNPPLEKQRRVPGIDTGRFNDSVITVNSTFLEVVDPGNRLRGINSFFAVVSLTALLYPLALAVVALLKYESLPPVVYFLMVLCSLILAFIFLVANALIRWDMFRKTHYPMRFNRVDRKVYAWSQDMGVVTMNWDDIHFYQSKASTSEERRGMGREEVRGYVKDAD